MSVPERTNSAWPLDSSSNATGRKPVAGDRLAGVAADGACAAGDENGFHAASSGQVTVSLCEIACVGFVLPKLRRGGRRTLGKLWMEVGSPHEKGAPNNQVIGSLLEIADVGFVLPNSPR